MRIKPLLLALSLLSLAGCATQTAYAERPRDLGGLVYAGADRMLDTARDRGLAPNTSIIIATTVNVDDLNASSTFGRLASQLVSSRLAQRGYTVRDVTYTGGLTIAPETGEMVLSRELQRVAVEHDAHAVVAASYAVGGERVYLNLRLLRAADGYLLSASDVAIPLDMDTQRMVVTGRPPAERRALIANGRLN